MRYKRGMTILLLAAAALLFAHLFRSRALRQQRWHAARELRRSERERQWRAMIRDSEVDRAG